MRHVREIVSDTGEQVADVAKGAIAGMAAGLVASWVMEQFQAHESQTRRQRTSSGQAQRQSAGGRPRDPVSGQFVRVKEAQQQHEPATVKAAEAVSRELFDYPLSKDEKKVAGPIMHYVMGAGSGFVYGAAAEVSSLATTGFGMLFGMAVWLLADEVAVPALGLAKKPTEYPVSTHADALGAHICYGITTDIVRRVIRAVL